MTYKATRLAEHPSLQIGVIEAGIYHHNDPNVDLPGKFMCINLMHHVDPCHGAMLFSPALSGPDYDWGFKSTPQAHSANRSIPLAR